MSGFTKAQQDDILVGAITHRLRGQSEVTVKMIDGVLDEMTTQKIKGSNKVADCRAYAVTQVAGVRVYDRIVKRVLARVD